MAKMIKIHKNYKSVKFLYPYYYPWLLGKGQNGLKMAQNGVFGEKG